MDLDDIIRVDVDVFGKKFVLIGIGCEPLSSRYPGDDYVVLFYMHKE